MFRSITLIFALAAFLAVEERALAHDTTAPVLELRVDPIYPREALEVGVEGTVVMEVYIDAKGAVEHVHVLSSPGHGLDEAAAAAAKQFRFKPATVDKAPVASQIVYEQQFKIDRRMRGEVTQPDLSPLPRETEHATETYVITDRAPMTSASSEKVRQEDFELRPRSSPNDILRVVPGLVTAQHQGGGKADQLFLRGFDADHGTDVAVFVDGIPVNLPSHAHGQGYADLHFVIPEVLQTVDVYKGAYYAQFGDFDTAGAVNLVTRRDISTAEVSVTGGSFDTFRFLGLGGGNTASASGWLAVEAAQTDGPFDHPEHLKRYNVWGKTTLAVSPDSWLGITATAYASEWIGSGQIPARLIGMGLRDEFDSLDPSEGGSTEREGVSLTYHLRPDPLSRLDARLYFINYKLALFNDFTFFLRDPVNGDEIEQDDARTVLGGTFEYENNREWRGVFFKSLLGAQFRRDDVHVDLWDVTSQNGNFRKRLRRHMESGTLTFGTNDDERVANLAFYLGEDVVWNKWLRTVAILRGDYFDYDVDDFGEDLAPGAPNTSGVKQQALLSPKASVVLTPHPLVDVYLNYGTGFHSNDARPAVRGEVGQIIPRAYEGEIGTRTRLLDDRLDAAFAFWYVYLESEIVFEGDSGTFAPQGATERYGADFELRWRIRPWLVADADVSLAHAAFVQGGADVPLAPHLSFSGGLTARGRGIKAALRVRGVGDRTAGDGLTAQGYTVLDAFLGYERRHWEALVQLENLLDTDWREAQFANLSCSRGEASDPTNPCHTFPSIHFTPGNPINALATLRLFF